MLLEAQWFCIPTLQNVTGVLIDSFKGSSSLHAVAQSQTSCCRSDLTTDPYKDPLSLFGSLQRSLVIVWFPTKIPSYCLEQRGVGGWGVGVKTGTEREGVTWSVKLVIRLPCHGTVWLHVYVCECAYYT